MQKLSRREAMQFAAFNLAISSVTASSARSATESEPSASSAKGIDLVFEGGGIKGAAFAGAIEVLEKKGYQYRRLIGSSAGAIVATCLAAGYKATELIEVLTERAPDGSHIFSTFLLPPEKPAVPEGVNEHFWDAFANSLLGLCRAFDAPNHLFSFKDKLIKLFKEGDPAALEKARKRFSGKKARRYVGTGLSLLASGFAADDRPFLEWMEKLLDDKHIPRNVTLEKFYAMTEPQGVQLSLVATDVSGQQILVLNNRTAPRLPLVQAVRMSMGIPMVWPEVVWKEDWGPYRKTRPMFEWENGKKAWHRVVDGGVLSNFPLRFLLDDEHRLPDGVLGPPGKDRSVPILGLLLDERKPASEAPTPEQKKRFAERLPVYQSASRLLDTMMSAWDKEAIEKFKDSICSIGVKGFDTLDFELEEGQVQTLIQSGRNAMEQFQFKS
jgi:NTE family protein